jgi:hypothetical protein
MKIGSPAVGEYAVLTLFLFAVYNIPARLIVDGVTESWFTFSVPEPERFADKMPYLTSAQLKRGWPWAFQDETGYPFVTKEGRELFLPKPNSPPLWRQLSIPRLLGDIAASCILAIMVEAVYGMLDRWLGRRSRRDPAIPRQTSSTPPLT